MFIDSNTTIFRETKYDICFDIMGKNLNLTASKNSEILQMIWIFDFQTLNSQDIFIDSNTRVFREVKYGICFDIIMYFYLGKGRAPWKHFNWKRAPRLGKVWEPLAYTKTALYYF